MEDFDEEFLMTFNEFYPFEKYIVKNPKRINDDGALLTEIFVQKTKTDTDLDSDENFLCRKYSDTNFYIKVKGDAGEMRFSYFDFAPHIREEIRRVFIEDFGQYNYDSLYFDNGDDEENQSLSEELDYQRKLITDKYGEFVAKFVYKDKLN